MVPGMAHCGGGDGPNAFGNGTSNGPVIDADHDLVKALERWVEQGVAPERIIATHYVNNTAPAVQFQRPLCPFPERGEYVGKGDSNDARISNASRVTTQAIRATSDRSVPTTKENSSLYRGRMQCAPPR